MLSLRLCAVLVLLSVLAVGAAAQFEEQEALSDVEWTTPTFVDFLEMESGRGELEASTEAEAETETEAQWPWSRKPAPVPKPAPRPVVAPKPVPRPAAPAPAPAPVVQPHNNPNFVPTGRVVANTPLGSPSSFPAGDLSTSEEATDSPDPEVPLNFSEDHLVRVAENKIPQVDAPKLAYSPVGSDDRLSLNGMPVPLLALPLVGSTGAQAKAVGAAAELCGSYVGSTISQIAGNQNIIYNVVKVLPKHSQNPASLSLSPSASDNTIRTVTACAFDRMFEAAKKDKITILIGSAFRTLGRQQYFKNCQLTKKCNKGRMAATPGTSNHGRGLALDLNQAAPGVYNWLRNHAHKFGFVRTVPKEKWHWEFRGVGTPRTSYT